MFLHSVDVMCVVVAGSLGGAGRGVSVTGQTVVEMAMVDVTNTVLAAGQFGFSEAQDVTVYTDSVSVDKVSLMTGTSSCSWGLTDS